MYFKDMSLYSYHRDEHSFNIGWLDDKHQYSRGARQYDLLKYVSIVGIYSFLKNRVLFYS